MSSEHLVHDVEKGHSIVVVREPPQKDTHWKCLSIFSFALLIGATVVFTLLQFGAFKQPGDEMYGESLSGLPDTLRVQAVASGKPAIHAIGHSVSDKQLIWTADVAGTLSKNGMKLDGSGVSIVVPSTGLYFVYSQLSFHSSSCPENPLVLNHKVLWQSSDLNTEVTLLNGIKTPCKGREDSKSLWFEAIYQGAVFELRKGDRLSSTTDTPEYLDVTQHGQVYFGIIAM